MDTIHHTEAAAIAEIAKKSQQATTVAIEADGRKASVLLVPDGQKATSLKPLLDEYLKAPERIKGTAEITSLDSFIAHANRFQDDESALFAHRDPTAPSLIAVYDYHPVVDGAGVAAKVARFCGHKARYSFPVADEWVAWTQASGKPMAQAAFAEFLENRVADVCDPIEALESARKIMDKLLCKFAGPSRLIELARGLSVRVESIVANKQDLQSGESTVRFEQTHRDEAGAPLEVPGAFLIGIPVFRSGAIYQLAARLRYRIKEGKMSWWFDLYRAQETFDHAFGEACEHAAKETDLPLFYGKHEG